MRHIADNDTSGNYLISENPTTLENSATITEFPPALESAKRVIDLGAKRCDEDEKTLLVCRSSLFR